MSKIKIGISGWVYPRWRGKFYPKGLQQKKELEYASRKLTSIEINSTFYNVLKPESFQNWYDQTPEDFSFAIKGGKFITHVRRLKDVAGPLANFFAQGILKLNEKLGPILWQFPPNMMLKDDRFEKFISMLPRTTTEAAKLAAKHSEWMNGRSWTKAQEKLPLRHAFEFRHPSFMEPEFLELLRRNNIAVVFAHAGEKSPYTEDLTADFIYARMHGQEKRFAKGYTDSVLDWWAERLRTWSQGKLPKDMQCVLDRKPSAIKRDAFVYFDTDAKDYAPSDALALIDRFQVGKKKAA
jgi:uncharacterized protein YecE (DUF72 family)